MADTSTTTKVSELAVPLFTAMLSNRDDPSQLITGGDMLSKADSYGISLGSDRLFWENLRAVPLLEICSKQPALIQQCIRTADNFCSIFDINWLAGAYYELVGRDNSGDDPSDFRIDGTGFSLKVGSPILWNTTPKSLLPYTDAVLFEKLENEALSYLQGVPLRSKSGEYKKNQPAYDWYLYADHDLCQRTYTNFLHSVFMLMYELRAGGVLQSEWNPHCGEGEWWARDCDGIPYPLTDNTDILGQTKIPLK